MSIPTLAPPPQPASGSSFARWLQQLWSSVSRVQLAQDGPTITTGRGAPSGPQPNGSLYLRSDGTGPNLYARENGAWVAK